MLPRDLKRRCIAENPPPDKTPPKLSKTEVVRGKAEGIIPFEAPAPEMQPIEEGEDSAPAEDVNDDLDISNLCLCKARAFWFWLTNDMLREKVNAVDVFELVKREELDKRGARSVDRRTRVLDNIAAIVLKALSSSLVWRMRPS